LAEELNIAYRAVAARLPRNTAVRVKTVEGRDRPVLTPLVRLDEPASLLALRGQAAALLSVPRTCTRPCAAYSSPKPANIVIVPVPAPAGPAAPAAHRRRAGPGRPGPNRARPGQAGAGGCGRESGGGCWRLVTVLLTLAVPAEAGPEDAAQLVADAAASSALQVVHATAVEGHLPVPGATVVRAGRSQPWLVVAAGLDRVELADLAGQVVHVPRRRAAGPLDPGALPVGALEQA